MQSRIFRQKSMERISSPEQLQDYMRVTTPGIWMVLAAVIVLLVGLIVSSALVDLESTIPGQAVVEEDGAALKIGLSKAQKELVKPGMAVRVGEREAVITMIYETADGVQVLAELKDGAEQLSAGTYDAEIVTGNVKPIGFLVSRME